MVLPFIMYPYSYNSFRITVLIFSFYEWQTAKPGKQPYFIKFADDNPTKETMQLSTDSDEFDDATKNSPFKGRLLTMAGYFDIWRPSSGVSTF